MIGLIGVAVVGARGSARVAAGLRGCFGCNGRCASVRVEVFRYWLPVDKIQSGIFA